MRPIRSGERIAERTVCPRHFIAIPRWRSWPADPRIGRRGPAKAHVAFLHPGQASRSNWPSAHGTTATPARRHGHDRNRLERGGMARHLHPWAAHWRQHHPRRPSRSRHLGRLCTHASVPHPLQPAGTRRFRPESAIKRTITRQFPTSRTWVTRLTSSCTGVVPLQTTRAQVVITGARGTEPAVRRPREPERVAHGETSGPRERDQRSRALVTRG